MIKIWVEVVILLSFEILSCNIVFVGDLEVNIVRVMSGCGGVF